MKFLMLFLTMLLFPFIVMAGSIETVWPVMGAFILGYAEQYPLIFTIILYMGSARLVMKPLMSLVLVVVDLTPSTSDNEFLEKLKTYWWYKSLVYLLDWSASVKLPVKK